MAVRRLAENQPEGFAFTPENAAWAERQMSKYPPGKQASAVLLLLWRAQEQHDGWLPEPAIRYVADRLGMAYIRALEIATFYTMFNLEPVGTYYVQLCGTTPCWLRGSDALKEVCERVIGPRNHVREDGKLSWIEVECLGACVNGPMAQINADFYEDLSAESFERLLGDLVAGRTVKPGPQVDRQLSAPIGGQTTLTTVMNGGARHAKEGGEEASQTDDNAKRPTDAANVQDAAAAKPPIGDSSNADRD